MLSLFTFVIGLIGGFAVYHFFFRMSPQEKKMADELIAVQSKFKHYQLKVKEHINQSAALMNDIQEKTDQLNDYILKSSVDLNLDSNKQSALQPSSHFEVHAPLHEEPLSEFHAHTSPKDYV
jgi:uncharacterized membrane-anchored protein YhcB (DUF1043 family)